MIKITFRAGILVFGFVAIVLHAVFNFKYPRYASRFLITVVTLPSMLSNSLS
jgi:hypothetical protein